MYFCKSVSGSLTHFPSFAYNEYSIHIHAATQKEGTQSMMKKLLCLLLSVSLLLGCAAPVQAQSYTPGSITQSLFRQAYERGEMIILDYQCGLTLADNAEEFLGEDAVMLRSIAKALPYTYLSLGAGKIDNGLRLMLGAEYAPGETQSAYASILLDLTRDGISLMGTAIEGERLTIKWETLLSLAGLDSSEIAMILSTQSIDFQALAAELAAQIEPLLTTAAQLAAPYAETIAAHIAALPMNIATDVPAQDNFPAAAYEIYVQATPKDVAGLLLALADQLAQDTALCQLLDPVLAQSGMTAADLCAGMRAYAAEIEHAPSVEHILIGLDEAQMPLYLQLSFEYADGESRVLTLMCSDGQAEGSTAVSIDAFYLSAEAEIVSGVSAGCEFIADPLDRNVLNLAGAFVLIEDREVLAQADFYTGSAATTTENGQSGYAATHILNMNATDGVDDIALSLAFDSMQSLTADGGEQGSIAGAIEVAAEGVQLPVSLEAYMLTAPSQASVSSVMSEFIRVPSLGIQEYMETMTLYTAVYDADLTANTTEIAFETASSEELEALGMRAAASLSDMANVLLELLPPETAQLLAKAIAAETTGY